MFLAQKFWVGRLTNFDHSEYDRFQKFALCMIVKLTVKIILFIIKFIAITHMFLNRNGLQLNS